MNNKKLGLNRIIKIFTTWRFVGFLILKLPMGFFARLRVVELGIHKSSVTVPYNYWNKNPFNSMYFAVQAMAAELSTGVLAILHTDGENISALVINLEAKYYKKAITKIHFICLDGEFFLMSVKKAIETSEAQICIMKSKGYDATGDCVSDFNVTWSLKKRR